MTRYGYVRSFKNTARAPAQREELRHAGCAEVFHEKKKALDALKAGDELMLITLDHLGQSSFHILQVIDELRERGVTILSRSEKIDLATADDDEIRRALPRDEKREPLKIGYIRVSTDDQSYDLQDAALQKYGCDKIFREKISGVKFGASRQSLDHALNMLEAGDELVVYKYDRLGRSAAHLLMLIDELRRRGVRVKSLTEEIDTLSASASGQLELIIRAAFSQYERGLISERTKAAMAVAKAEGRHIGRPPKVTPNVRETIYSLRDAGKSVPYIAETLKLGQTTVKTVIREAYTE
jgi:DNA invertase Pin-like site-specific DNA recombinase